MTERAREREANYWSQTYAHGHERHRGSYPSVTSFPAAEIPYRTNPGHDSYGLRTSGSEGVTSQPYSHSTPDSPSSLDARDASPDPDEEHDSREDDYDDDGQGTQSSTDARIEKRKMKRFRLTHNQTRFLMSEFTRQAHPDAAHRERLSREVPGLSPRQVQVWFQNRRAKLKRLTTDDRERMIRSRALPEDFDMTQALHAKYGSGTVNPMTPVTSPGSYRSAFGDDPMGRSATSHPVRRAGDAESAPSSAVGVNFANLAFPSPGSTSNGLSPVSSSSDRSHLEHASGSISMSDRSMSGPMTSEGFRMPPPPMPLQTGERLGGVRSEPRSSPLRSEMTLPGAHLDHKDYGIGPTSSVQFYHQEPIPQSHLTDMATPYYGPFTKSISDRGSPTPAAETQAYHAQLGRDRAGGAFSHTSPTEPIHPPLVLSPGAYPGYEDATYHHQVSPHHMNMRTSFSNMYMSPTGPPSQGQDIGPDHLGLHPGFEALRRRAYTHPSEYLDQ
ncbi:MAG: hypothetical protein M4579_002755 [Chaenotheca gracillima]|nr:MAG: hypothetical protein M4579_002755 [Chaenotheca gracillima]